MAEPEALLRAGHVVELGFIQTALEPIGYSSEINDPTDTTLVPELVVLLGDDDEGRIRSLRIGFVPEADELTSTKLLHFYSPLPFTAAEGVGIDNLRAAVAIVNEHVAIGAFGVHNDASLYFRYLLAGGRGRFFDDDMVVEIVAFIDFHQEHFGDYLDGVCAGEVSVAVLADVIARAEAE